jgi:hypothetical protein
MLTHEYIASNFNRIGEPGIPDLALFRESTVAYQRRENRVYGRFDGYAYLPIQAFKRLPVTTFPPESADAVFLSSGTSGTRSRHFVRDLDMYRRSVVTHFRSRFGDKKQIILAHLPSYAELGKSSSLVTMTQILIDTFGLPNSGYFLDDVPDVSAFGGEPVLLIGAAFGLMALAEEGRLFLPAGSCVIETGGMKTVRRELERAELHRALAAGFGVDVERITSEYGMCELLSQFYMGTDGLFYPPPWVEFEIIDPADQTTSLPEGVPGALAVFDTANLYSVSAILTQDRAIWRGAGVELLGRLSGAELRGCNFLVEERIGTSSE